MKFTRKSLSEICYQARKILPARENLLRIIYYHKVDDIADTLAVKKKEFQMQIAFLVKEGYRCIGLSELKQWLKGNLNLKGKEIIISFDDCYEDNFYNAFPVLVKHNLKAVFFPIVGFIDTDNTIPRYKNTPYGKIMNWHMIKEMSQAGMEFGSHGLMHIELTRIDDETLFWELKKSKELLEEKIGKEVTAFCYPRGKFDERVLYYVKKAGYEIAFTTMPGINSFHLNPYLLKRTEISSKDTIYDFKKKLEGGYDLLQKLANYYDCKVLHRRESDLHIKQETTSQSVALTAYKSLIKGSANTLRRKYNLMLLIWSLGLGGAEQVVINLARGLDKKRFNVMVCCLNEKGIFAQELEKEGIKVVALHKKGKFDFTVIFKLIFFIRKYRIDLLHTHLWGANFWGRIAGKLAGVKIVITEHNVDAWKPKMYLLLDKLLFHFTHKFIVVSEIVKNFYSKEINVPSEKIDVIYNGIDVNRYSNPSVSRLAGLRVKKELGISEEIILGIFGRLVPQKGHNFMFEALFILKNHYSLKLLIVGDGPLRSSLEATVYSQHLEKKVLFLGLRKDIPNLLNCIDILVMPSLREGLPIIALEAMASGLPIVATDVGGIRELIIDKKTGFIVPPKNPEALAKAVKKLIEDKELRNEMGKRAKERVKKYFSLEKMVKRHEQLYMKLIAPCSGKFTNWEIDNLTNA